MLVACNLGDGMSVEVKIKLGRLLVRVVEQH